MSGIWSTASGALSGFRSEEALEATCRPDFDPEQFVRSSDTIYIAAPAHRQALVAPMVVGLIDDIRHATYARSARSVPDVTAVDHRSCWRSTRWPTSPRSPIFPR